jgi:uroporphyrinogen decarboxylase
MERRLETRADIDALAPAEAVTEKLAYVADALRLVKKELAPAAPQPAPGSPNSALPPSALPQSALRIPHSNKALLGFGGSPWTLAAYMLEGGSSGDFARATRLFRADRAAFGALLEKLTAALIVYFKMQIAAGADAIQIFDTWGGVIPAPDYEAVSLRWIREIIAALPGNFPVILYAKNTAPQHAAQAASGARVLGIDWRSDLAAVRRALPASVALQGNLDPAVLQTTPENTRRETARLLESMRGLPGGHIFNLGHGITPQAGIECVEALVETVTGWR